MMTFQDFHYERPDFNTFKQTFTDKLDTLKATEDFKAQLPLIDAMHEMMGTIDSMYNIVYIRHTIDTKDAYYEAESAYWDEHMPLYEEVMTSFKKVLVASPYRAQLEEKFSKQYFAIMSNDIDTFSPEIIEEMKEENKLVTAYNKLLAGAELSYKGKIYNLSGLTPFSLSPDRAVREEVAKLSAGFFEANAEAFDTLYDKLVKVRHQMARKLGMPNYTAYAYKRMNRTDYNETMVVKFREQVKALIVPVANKLYARQKERLGLDTLHYFDEKFEFTTGNATPQGDAAFILEQGKKMYNELSQETKVFFDFMTKHELMDLETKPGKQVGGYCTFIYNEKSPFIFSNFNGTSGDIDVLTHEAGHAFQCYQSRHTSIPSMIWPTYESAEIHSMSMEFITWPWMKNFFGPDTEKYKYTHLGSAIKFIPYGIVVDAFQHFVYANPDATPQERKAHWRELEKEYLPHKHYDGFPVLEEGGWWYRQSHIFQTPFYYIDYTLAQICALQFWKKMQVDREAGWQDYLALCDKGGTLSFLQLVEEGHLKSPFEAGCVASIIGDIEAYLMAIDDKAL